MWKESDIPTMPVFVGYMFKGEGRENQTDSAGVCSFLHNK